MSSNFHFLPSYRATWYINVYYTLNANFNIILQIKKRDEVINLIYQVVISSVDTTAKFYVSGSLFENIQ